ncbi:hypothetical protein VTK73DRAFT_6357 [Phialemonium thermophilum]|uniref:Uncharacterized protein n=1 Tax=Phialemonium thermophilum TaxID=223376 RepID=A0ABR3UZK4_9PEZI
MVFSCFSTCSQSRRVLLNPDVLPPGRSVPAQDQASRSILLGSMWFFSSCVRGLDVVFPFSVVAWVLARRDVSAFATCLHDHGYFARQSGLDVVYSETGRNSNGEGFVDHLRGKCPAGSSRARAWSFPVPRSSPLPASLRRLRPPRSASRRRPLQPAS